MPSPPDRLPADLEVWDPEYPIPPLNITCASGYDNSTIDLWWSSPAELSVNTSFNIVGVNVYRSFDSEFGPYTRLNALPIQANFYVDRTMMRVALEEDVSDRFLARAESDPMARFIFITRNTPLVIQPAINTPYADLNVYVTVDGVPARVLSVIASTGEVELDSSPVFDVVNQKQTPAVLPSPNSKVLCSYRYIEQGPRTSLYQRLFYRVTTVAASQTGELIETPIHRASQTNSYEIEKLDYIWREAIRRNKFILAQAGERVKVFIRKTVGVKCGCLSDLYKQPASDCLVCYGTGIIGGYDGPYDILIAPDEAEKKIAQSNRGRNFEHVYDTWTGPNPLLSMRDFMVKLNGDRYGIGAVKIPTNRGMQLQQHFMVSHLDESDIIYKVPVLDVTTLKVPQTRYIVDGEGRATPMTTDREAIPAERQIRGRTATYENINRR